MRRYELTFIVDPDVSDDKRGAILDKVKGLIEKDQGLIVDVDEWGQKKLAYEIRKKTRGYYICINLCGTPALVDELERMLRLDDKVLKYMTLILEKQVDMDSVQNEMKDIEQKKIDKKPAATEEETKDEVVDEKPEEETTEEEEA